VFSNLFSITLPNIGKYFSGIHFPWNSLSKKKLLSSKQTGPKTKMKFHLKILPGEKIALEGKNLFPVKWLA
jgi:hypothetical protein